MKNISTKKLKLGTELIFKPFPVIWHYKPGLQIPIGLGARHLGDIISQTDLTLVLLGALIIRQKL